MELELELRPLRGVENTALGPVEIEHDMWLVVVKCLRGGEKRWTQVGSLPHKGNRVLWLSVVDEPGEFKLNETQKAAINKRALEEADKLRNTQVIPPVAEAATE